MAPSLHQELVVFAAGAIAGGLLIKPQAEGDVQRTDLSSRSWNHRRHEHEILRWASSCCRIGSQLH